MFVKLTQLPEPGKQTAFNVRHIVKIEPNSNGDGSLVYLGDMSQTAHVVVREEFNLVLSRIHEASQHGLA